MTPGSIPFPATIPFVQELGIEMWAAQGGVAELRLALKPNHANSLQMAHGGVVMTMLDVAMAQAARTVQPTSTAAGAALVPQSMITIEMKTSFVRPAVGAVVAHGKVLHRTLSLAFCEASLLDSAGRLCAHATGTFKYVRPTAPAQGRVAIDPVKASKPAGAA